MKLLVLHDRLNPTRTITLDAEDFSVAHPYLDGSLLKMKGSDAPFEVEETPEEIYVLLNT